MNMPSLMPDIWAETLSGRPVVDRRVPGLMSAHVRHWRGIDPAIDQSALDHHFLSIHLGGAKRLTRRGEGATRMCDAPAGAHSVVPAGAAFQWNTEGPVDFAHVYFEPRAIDRVIAEAFDRDPAAVSLREGLGAADPLVLSLAMELLEELGRDEAEVHKAYLDDLVHLLLCRALKLHSAVAGSAEPARHALAPYRLRRAIDFIEAHLTQDIGVADIAEASGISRYHFSRAFREATGRAPYAYLLDQRLAAARKLLVGTTESAALIAGKCGFAGAAQFSRLFKRVAGVTPTEYRQRY